MGYGICHARAIYVVDFSFLLFFGRSRAVSGVAAPSRFRLDFGFPAALGSSTPAGFMNPVDGASDFAVAAGAEVALGLLEARRSDPVPAVESNMSSRAVFWNLGFDAAFSSWSNPRRKPPPVVLPERVTGRG